MESRVLVAGSNRMVEWLQRHVGIGDTHGLAPRPRDFRIGVLLAVLGVFNLFDLAFTQSQVARGNFAEMNALAASLADGAAGLAAYKSVFFGLGAYLLYRYRRRWQSEAGLWGLVACYGGLMVWWLAYLKTVELCLNDPAVSPPPMAY